MFYSERDNKMEKKRNFLVSAILITVIIAFITYLLTRDTEQTLAEAAGTDPNDTDFFVTEIAVYDMEPRAGYLAPIHLTDDERKKLNELVLSTKVSGKRVDYPFGARFFATQNFIDTQGNRFSFNTYVDDKMENFVFINHFNDRDAWYQMKGNELQDFYLELLEKAPKDYY